MEPSARPWPAAHAAPRPRPPPPVLRQPRVRRRSWGVGLPPAPASEWPVPPWPRESPRPQAGQSPPAPVQLLPRKRRLRPAQTPPPSQLAAEARSRDRRSPADRSSRACRSTRKAPSARRPHSGPPSPPPTPLPRARRASPRSTRGGRAWPCTQTASGSTPSSRRSAPSRQRTPHPPRGRAQGCRWAHLGRRRGAGRPRRGASGRTRTAAAPSHRPATSTRLHRRRGAHTRK